MSTPYSRTIVDGMVTALKAISTGSGDNTTTNYAETYDRDSGPDEIRASHVVRMGSRSKTREYGRCVVQLSVIVSSRLQVDTDPGAASLDEQLDLFGHDIDVAIWPLTSTLSANIEQSTQTAVEELDSEDPVIGLVTTYVWTYDVDLATQVDAGPGE